MQYSISIKLYQLICHFMIYCGTAEGNSMRQMVCDSMSEHANHSSHRESFFVAYSNQNVIEALNNVRFFSFNHPLK